MKLNYRDKIILGVLLAMIILIGGFVGLIKPKSQSLADDKATLETKQQERDEVQAKIDQIKPLQNEIEETYKNTNKLVEDFIPTGDVDMTYKVDQMMRQTAEDCEVKITRLELSGLSSGDLEYYYLEESQLAEDLFKAADINGSLQAAYDELTAESSALKDRDTQEVISNQYAITVTGTRENVWNYMKALEDFGDARIIDSVQFSDYTFGTAADPDADDEEETTVDFVMSFYSVFAMDKPNTDAE